MHDTNKFTYNFRLVLITLEIVVDSKCNVLPENF